MIVVAVIAILAAIAYPNYANYVMKARRADAKTALLDLASRQERYFSMRNQYTNAGVDLGYGAAFPTDVQTSGTAYYRLTVTAASATAFAATAAPIGPQVTDKCGTYAIDQLGTQSNTGGTLTSAECW